MPSWQRRQAIVTADPHAYNALKNDYQGYAAGGAHQPVHDAVKPEPSAEAQAQTDGRQGLTPITIPAIWDGTMMSTTSRAIGPGCHTGPQAGGHDRCRDRSFCCGGGGLMLFYEPEEEQRMGVLRVRWPPKPALTSSSRPAPSAWSTWKMPSRWPVWKDRWKPSIWN
jgi:hypothetical protein